MDDEDRNPLGNLVIMPSAAVAARFGDLQMALDALASSDPVFVFMATQAICHVSKSQDKSAALKPLLKLFESDSYAIRWAAVMALGELGDQRAVKPLIDMLGDRNFCVQVAAADSLGKLANPCAVGALAALLDRDNQQNAYVRAAAGSALGAMDDPDALAALIKSLEDEHVAVVVSAVSGALGGADEPAAVQPLVDALHRTNINSAAALSLGKLRRHLMEKHILDILYPLKNGHSYNMRANCALAIGEIGWPGTFTYLEETARDDASMAVRWAVAKALGKSADKKEALRVLLGLLRGPEKQVSAAALESAIALMREVSPTALKEKLSIAMMSFDDAERLSAAAEAAEAYVKLAGLLETPEDKDRRAAERQMKLSLDRKLTEMEANAGIKESLRHIRKLEKKGGAEAVQSLAEMLGEQNGRVRKAASDSLERLLRSEKYPDIDAILAEESSGDRLRRLRHASDRFLEIRQRMASDARQVSRSASALLPTAMDTGSGKTKTRI
ncbi:MAG: HEAT repeat domain-containing protein [Candidatus Micrarchaeota archaeon]